MSDEKLVALETERVLALASEENMDMPLGYDEDDEDDVIIPRVKVIQSLSPERKDKIADEGDIINSLTKEKLNGKVFIPVFMFKNNILWRKREDGGGILCQAKDGKCGITLEGGQALCKACKRNEFDNSKQGKEAIPDCTKYINFFGIFEGEKAPIILSFAKTNFAEGKKLYSLAKVTMQNMFNNKYSLFSKEVTKGNNSWFITDIKAEGPTTQEDRDFALALYKNYKGIIAEVNMDIDSAVGSDVEIVEEVIVDTDSMEY